MSRTGPQHRHSEMNAWCHGAAGIGLARTFLLPIAETTEQEALLKEDFERVRASAYLGPQSHCLCHGKLGNLFCVQRVAKAMGDVAWETKLQEEAEDILREIVKTGAESGLGMPFHRALYPGNPTLMHGISGIGLGIIYMLQPHREDHVLAGELINRVATRDIYSPASARARTDAPALDSNSHITAGVCLGVSEREN